MRDKGDGSVYQRADGRWVGQIEDGYTKTGARAYRRRVRDTETEARRAVRDMLRANPAVVDYVRRALLQPNAADSHLVDVLVDLTQREVRAARKTGRASTTRRENTQVVAVLARQMGELLLAPMVDAVWARVAPDTKPPRLRVTVDEAGR